MVSAMRSCTVLPVAMKAILQETEATFEQRGAIAQRALNGLPPADFVMREREHANLHEPLAGRLPFTELQQHGEEDRRLDEIKHLLPDFSHHRQDACRAGFVRVVDVEKAKRRFEDRNDDDVDRDGVEAALECRQRQAFELVHAGGFVRVEGAVFQHPLDHPYISLCFSGRFTLSRSAPARNHRRMTNVITLC